MLRDFSEIRGVDSIVLALARAVSERKRVLLVGPPGCGKTMLAARTPGLLGDPDEHERRWIAAELVGWNLDHKREIERPFRAPHHTVSTAALAGGGPSWSARQEIPKPVPACRCKTLVSATCRWHTLPKGPIPHAGEARLARFGVLFLDEIEEFHLAALDALFLTLHEMGETAPYVLASGNLCPCGWRGMPSQRCQCSERAIETYRARQERACRILRIEERIEVPLIDLRSLKDGPPGKSTAELRALI